MYESSELIRWRTSVLRAKSEPELEQELRGLCEHGAWLSPELARDVVFWLDVGLPPRTVERWLCDELMGDPGGAFSEQAHDAEPSRRRSSGPEEPSPVSPTEKRRRSRIFRRRRAKVRERELAARSGRARQ